MDDLREHQMGLGIDIRTVSGLSITANGRRITPKEVIKFWIEKRVLIYDGSKGNAPILYDVPKHAEESGILAIDVVGMKKEDLDKIMKELKKKK